MDTKKAKEIIKSYQKALEKSTVGETILRKNSWLNNSKAIIKYAYFTFIENEITEKGSLPEQEKLIEEYSQLNTFVEDLATEKYAAVQEHWNEEKSKIVKDKKAEVAIKQYLAYTHTLGINDLKSELQEFISEVCNYKNVLK